MATYNTLKELSTSPEIFELFDKIVADYEAFADWNTDYFSRDRFRVTVGKKYLKIYKPVETDELSNELWGFLALDGTILKAATFSAPAKGSRGNILNGSDYVVNWTGPLYLR